MQWKTGEEKDGKGFYWSTKLAVQQAWEQHNLVEEPQNYRTFRSVIHVQMIPIICFELKISRQNFDIISDSDLIEKLDAKLKPSGPIEYLLKLRQIKFNNNSASDTLLHRYRAFAEPFLQLVAESNEAGCDINGESIKLAFKAACRGNDLLMTFLQESKWLGVEDAHQRIVEQLRKFNALQTMNSLNGNASDIPQPQIMAPPVQYQVAPPPPQIQLPPPQIQQPAPHPQAPRQHYPSQPRQQTAMVNVMNQLMSRFDQLDRAHANSVAAHVSTPVANFANAPASPSQATVSVAPMQRAPKVHDLTPHPGLDARGPFWHPAGLQFACNFTPCTALFCQGCGRHGHTSAECMRKTQPGWNVSGYFAERYPGQGALIHATGAPLRIANASVPPAQAFPTPFRTNTAGGGGAAASPQQVRFSPVVRSNVATQSTPAADAARE
jgi:hypothetical protein